MMAPLPADATQDSQAAAETLSNPTSATLLTTFGTGRSYIFKVANRSRSVEDCWKDLFKGRAGWSFDKFRKYDKPLGETATFTFGTVSEPDATNTIKNLQDACDKLHAYVNIDSIEASIFTTGVAILVVRLTDKDRGDPIQFLNTVQTLAQLNEVQTCLRAIIQCCTKAFLAVMDTAENERRSLSKQGWFLKRFREVDREGWKPKSEHSYPLFFVDPATYQKRTDSILDRVSSKLRRKKQSDRATVCYQDAGIYVDWSGAFVKQVGECRERIENNFVIALASWFALVLMNKNSSIFLFEAFADVVQNKHRADPAAVHKSMAYKDVADASTPIRWTTRRMDLFLLETIHRNWSSERWRTNIEERMKVLALHYQRLEDEHNERSSKMLALAATFLALFTLASAIADVINLAENDGQPSRWVVLGYPLKEIDVYLSFLPVVIALVVAALWMWRVIKAKIDRRRDLPNARETL